MIWRFCFQILFISTVIFATNNVMPAAESKEDKMFRAGAAKANITPPLGTSLAGYMRDRQAQNVHDELYARSLALDNGNTKLIFVICDLIALRDEDIEKAKYLITENTDLPPDHMMIAATHTHTGPTTAGLFQSEPDKEYLDWLAVRIADSARMACQNLQPAQIGWGAGKVEEAVFNRRFYLKPGTMPPNPWGSKDDLVKMNPGYNNPNIVKPAGPTDPDVYILSLQTPEGKPIAVLGNYTLHYVGGTRSTDISADYFGMWSKIIEQEYGQQSYLESPPFVAMLTNGCSGDINNINVREKVKEPPYGQMKKVARMVAQEAIGILNKIEYKKWVPLDIQETHLKLGVRKPTKEEVEQAEEALKNADTVLKTYRKIYSRETVLLDEWPDTIQTLVQAIRIGDLAIATFPGEAFVELGLEVKEKSPFSSTFCIELANDYAGYIPTEKAHKEGGYETWRARSSFLVPNAAPKMLSTIIDMLHSMNDS